MLDVHAAEAGGRVLVVDHKTDRLEGRDPEDAVTGSYATQRLVYALAALRAGAAAVEVAHCFLERPGHPATATFSRADRAGVEARLAGLAGGIAEGQLGAHRPAPPGPVPLLPRPGGFVHLALGAHALDPSVVGCPGCVGTTQFVKATEGDSEEGESTMRCVT